MIRPLMLGLLAATTLTAMPVLAADPVQAAVDVRSAWARATPPAAGVGAVYLTILGGAKPDTLLGATTDRAAMTQVHEVTESAGVSRMREAGAVRSPGKSVVFKPQGLHFMLMGLTRPLLAGERFDLTLRFEHAGQRVVAVSVLTLDAPAPKAP